MLGETLEQKNRYYELSMTYEIKTANYFLKAGKPLTLGLQNV